MLITSECMRVTPCFTLEYTIMKNQSQYPKGRYVDINVHIGEGIDIEGQPFTFNSLLEWMDNNEISQAMVLSSICIPEEKNINGMSNDEALKEFEKYQSRLFPFCVIHPNFQSTKKDLVKLLQQFKEKGVKGFGELKPGNDLTIDDPKCMRLYEACSKVQLPVLFHMDDQHCIDNPGLSPSKSPSGTFGLHFYCSWPRLVGIDFRGRKDPGRNARISISTGQNSAGRRC